MENKNENEILKAVEENDVESLKKALFGYCLGQKEIPILSMAVQEEALDVIKFLIDSGCDVWESDKDGNTALHLLLTDYGFSWTNRLEIVDILLTAGSNFIEGLFVKPNKMKMTPFLLACALGGNCDEMQSERDAVVGRFVALVEANSITIPIDRLIGERGNNVFHFLCNSYTFVLSPIRLAAVRALIVKFPCDQLIDAKNHDGQTPSDCLFFNFGGFADENVMVEIAKLFFQHGASPDTLDEDGYSYFERVIGVKNVALSEVLLRAGCCTDIVQDSSPLRVLIYGSTHPESIRIVDLLLAFGFSLQNEPYLYAIDERPIKFTSPEYAAHCDTSRMDPDVLEALREIRRSNKMLSLQRQCRNTIRRHLKGKADEVIGNLVCIPEKIKSFLLVKNEEPLLEITGQ